MNESWVTVARHEDLGDADWEAAVLVEADIPAVVVEPDHQGPVEIRVESEFAERARRLLAERKATDEQGPPEEAEAEPETYQVWLASAAQERQRLFTQALAWGVVGCVPPLALYSLWLVVRGIRQPEPMAFSDYFDLGRAVAVAGFWLTLWLLALLK